MLTQPVSRTATLSSRIGTAAAAVLALGAATLLVQFTANEIWSRTPRSAGWSPRSPCAPSPRWSRWDVLRAEPRTDPDRIAAIGYGAGGAIVLELARDGVELRAIATVNALTTGRPGEAARIRCPVWAGVGSEDPIQPPAQREAFAAEMQSAGVDWRLVTYGGALHAFHHPPTRAGQTVLPGVGYHPRHAQRAWHDVVDLLAECLPVSE